MTMHSGQKTKPFADYEMMMLREGWNPRCELLELEITRLEAGHEMRGSFTCEVCVRLAAILHKAARRLEEFAATSEPV